MGVALASLMTKTNPSSCSIMACNPYGWSSGFKSCEAEFGPVIMHIDAELSKRVNKKKDWLWLTSCHNGSMWQHLIDPHFALSSISCLFVMMGKWFAHYSGCGRQIKAHILDGSGFAFRFRVLRKSAEPLINQLVI